MKIKRLHDKLYLESNRYTKPKESSKMLLKIFDQAILNNDIQADIESLSNEFQRRGHLIEAKMPALFQSRPETILDMFLHIANDSTIEGVAPSTMRQLRTARRRLNKFLHTIPKARQTAREQMLDEIKAADSAAEKAVKQFQQDMLIAALAETEPVGEA